MERLDGSVRRALRGAGVPDAGVLAEVTRVWPAAVGDAVARSAWPQRVARDGTLHVTCVSSTWAFELGRMEDDIRARLAEHLEAAEPPPLRFAPGPVPSPGAVERPPYELPAPDPDGGAVGGVRERPDRRSGAPRGGAPRGRREPGRGPRRPCRLIYFT